MQKSDMKSFVTAVNNILASRCSIFRNSFLVWMALLCTPVHGSGIGILNPDFFNGPGNIEDQLNGIIRPEPKTGMELLLAYLHLSGKFSEGHRGLFEAYVEQRNVRQVTYSYRDWQEALEDSGYSLAYRNTDKWLSRTVTRNNQSYVVRYYFTNCLSDAFATAITTLESRSDDYGPDSELLREWIDGQNRVFSNCGEQELSLPDEPAPGWPAQAVFDREYQIAAAYFYHLEYQEAARRFRLIAENSNSPWSDVSRYLVGRSLIRDATVNENNRDENLRAALTIFEALAEDEAYLSEFPSVSGQIKYISARLDLIGYRSTVGAKIINSPETATPAELKDYLYLMQSFSPYAADNFDDTDFGLWFSQARRKPTREGSEWMIDKWQEDQGNAWLFLALLKTDWDTPGVDQLLDAAERYPEQSPGAAGVFINALQMKLALREFDAVRTASMHYLADNTEYLTPSEINLIQYLAAKASRSWLDYAEESLLHPVMASYDNGVDQPVPEEALQGFGDGTRLFPGQSIRIINDFYTAAMLLAFIQRNELESYQRGRIAVSGWIKSLMVRDEASAVSFAAIMQEEFPQLRSVLQRFLDSDDKLFEAALILVYHPGFSPYLHSGFGRYTFDSSDDGRILTTVADSVTMSRVYNWWCKANTDSFYRGAEGWKSDADTALASIKAFDSLGDEELAVIFSLRPALDQSMTEFFGPYILDYARTTPNDPRVPLALERLVFATRYACDSGPADISRAAFRLLHRVYPESESTTRTPFWYN